MPIRTVERVLDQLREAEKRYPSQAALAEAIGVDKSRLNRWLKGSEEPNFTLETLEKLAQGLGKTLPVMISGASVDTQAMEVDGRDYRLLGLALRAGAGGPIQNHKDDEALKLAFRADWLRYVCGTDEITEDKAFLVEVHGDSMEPTIRSGAVVLACRWRPPSKPDEFESGSIFVMKEDVTADVSGLVVKRLTLDVEAKALIIESDNADYRSRVLPLDGRDLRAVVLGRVVWVGHMLEGRLTRLPGMRTLGKKPGRPRTIRRQPELGLRLHHDEDEEVDRLQEV